MDAEFVERLIRAVDESGIDTVEIRRGGTRVRISKTPPPAPVRTEAEAGPVAEAVESLASGDRASTAPAESTVAGDSAAREQPATTLIEIKSPMVGTFYRAGAPGAPPYVDTGQRISEGDTLCIIEAMKLMNEFESDISGTIEEILVEDGEPVEYGQVLFRVAPV
ncbi:MAG: acetyl-CoA carboxylase biotin carboxyl carrier protein [Gammaproteobacteria bacterium]|nr:acetyl-CoA carboxylase biotin carboxyl carrier protein [Gammaproteobacteria bacterium]MYF60109.1 acetyl-CoA carboxylase biotin carboxyl carrier protein [Gammaproteobacteria bacterium]MYI23602.1 acetyl-CoA carboxylase biotin carboxyl carrier protein [Gammaproteobacteria bacterium]